MKEDNTLLMANVGYGNTVYDRFLISWASFQIIHCVKNVSVCLSALATSVGLQVEYNNAVGLYKQKDVGIFLHTEPGSKI